jgi:hypothetical protein
VAKTPEKPEGDSPSPAPTPPAAPQQQQQQQQQQQPQQQQRQQVTVDTVGSVTSYANFCRVTGTPEELIIDFGLNTQPFGVPTDPVKITQRIVTNFFTAKRMLHALQLTLQRHEAAFGVLETDVQKRVVGGMRPQQPPPQQQQSQ